MKSSEQKKTVLFICTRNSARSQMAEGIANGLFGDRVESYSAGTHPGSVHPSAIRALAEWGIDISGSKSKSIESFAQKKFDIAVTLCDGAQSECPFFAGAARTVHKSFPDPAAITGTDEERLTAFRQVRDAILKWLKQEFFPGPVEFSSLPPVRI